MPGIGPNRGVGLVDVHLRNHAPANRIEIERAVGGEHRDAAVVGDDGQALTAADRILSSRGAHRQLIDHVPLPLDLVDGCRRQRRAAERGDERLPVFDHESAPAPHQQIGPDEVAFPRLSHSLPLPLEAPRGDADDPVDGKLEREDPDHLRAVEDRREDKPHRQSRIGHVGFDVGNPEGILVTRVGEQHGSPGEIRSRERPGLQVRGEVGAFFQRIDDLEGVVVDEEDVLVAKQRGGPLHPIADGLMNDAVFRIISALGERGTLTFGPDATLLGEKVVVLEVALSRLRRQILLDHRRPAEMALEFGDELLGIPATQFLVLLRFEGGVFLLRR